MTMDGVLFGEAGNLMFAMCISRRVQVDSPAKAKIVLTVAPAAT
jgi:hypothetical protein